jgi:hypothetical protein
MTVAEVVIATFILLLGIMATFQLFDAATRNTFRAEQSQVALDRAQRELEELRGLEYDQLAMTALPAGSSDPNDPRDRVAGTTFDVQRGGGDSRPMVYNGGSKYGGGTISGGVVNPGPEPFTSGDVSGNIYRFIVWQDDPTCAATCPGPQDMKRIAVAVTLDDVAVSYQRSYVEQQSEFVDPNDSVISDLEPGEGNEITAEQFWLSDTPCEPNGSTNRVVPLADHPLHNTLGTCADGLRIGSTPGAPDALLLNQPPDTDPGDPGLPNPRDYSNDAYLEPVPDTDRGVQILRQPGPGCDYSPAAPPEAEAQIHRWVSDPVPQAFRMTGKAVLEVSTRAINDAHHRGRICVYLFVRQETPGPVPTVTDTPILNAATLSPFFIYQPGGGSFWPRNAWTKIRIQMNFNTVNIAPGLRLGMAISVDRTTTDVDALQFIYDHHIYPSRLEIDTTTPLN